MPIQRQDLVECLRKMKRIYLAAPSSSVWSQKFINVLHDYCITELHRIGISDENFLY